MSFIFKNFQSGSEYFFSIQSLVFILTLATSHKSNLFSSKKVTLKSSSTLSSVAKSPGLNNL